MSLRRYSVLHLHTMVTINLNFTSSHLHGPVPFRAVLACKSCLAWME